MNYLISVDLGWHGQGHREFLNVESDIGVLSSFVKKYIPPHVPLFVIGHSWGSVFSELIMRRTDRPTEEFSFHPNLQGVVILSTAVDAAPGKSKKEKYAAYFKRIKEAKVRSETEAPEGELRIFTNIIRDGKTSPIGGAYSMHVISQLDQSAPAHKGKDYIEAMMGVGGKDALVRFGFEDLYGLYRKLANMETHYFDKPMPHNKEGTKVHEVGHDIFGAVDLKSGESVVHILIRKFIAKQLAFNAFKKSFIKEVQLSSIEEPLRTDIIDTIKNIKSISKMRDFIGSNETIKAIFDSKFLNNKFAKQLAFDTFKDDLIRVVQSSSMEESFKADVVDSIKNIRSNIEMMDFIESNEAVKKLFDSKFLDDSYNKFANYSEPSFDLEKINLNKTPTPNLIRLMQLTANDLAFREFLPDFVHYKETKTSTYIKHKEHIRIEQTEQLIDLLVNYNTYPRRLKVALEQITNVEDVAGLRSLYKEIEFVTTLFSEGKSKKDREVDVKNGKNKETRVNKKINNRRIENDIVTLKEEVQRLVDLDLFSNRQLSDIQEMAQQILEKYASFFNVSSKNAAKIGLIGAIIKANNLKEVRDIIEPEQLPPAVIKKTMALMEKFLVRRALILLSYSPNLEGFRVLNMPIKDKLKGLGIIKQLTTVIRVMGERENSRSAIAQEKKKLKNKYNTLLNEVKSNISELKEIFQHSNYQPPPILLAAHNRSAEELKKVEKAVEEMDKALDRIFREETELQDLQIIEMLTAKRPVIDNFINSYTRYIQNRQLLREQLIIAGERGEMGSKFREIVISLYGHGSGGRTSRVGTDNKYTTLENVILELAKVEAKIKRLEKLQVEGKEKYDELMNDLQRIMSKNGQLQIADADLIQDASNLLTIVDYPLLKILNGNYGDARLNMKNTEEVIDYIDDHQTVFSEAVNHWNNLDSRMPPLLPTAVD